MMRPLLLPVLALSLAAAVHAQAPCGTVMPPHPLMPHGSGLERGSGPFVVPTVVHIHYGGSVQPVGVLHVAPILAQCNRDLRALNTDIGEVVPAFTGLIGDLGIELRLATVDDQGGCMSGIRYHSYDPQMEGPHTLTTTLDTRRYLNIHIFPSTNSFATLPGLASAPPDPTDVIVLSSWDAANRPHALAHELGHWMGLLHTFGTGDGMGVVCGDDGITDTPGTAGGALVCDLTLDHCAPGLVENVQNIMDYSSCPRMFTQGQAAHVGVVLSDPTLVRAALGTSANLLATGVDAAPTCALTADIHARTSAHCAGTEVSFRAIAEQQVPDELLWSFPGGSPASSIADDPMVTYAASGTYTATLTACRDGACITVQRSMDVVVPDATANGLPMVDALPFSEGFEGGFAFPQAHMRIDAADGTTWQPFAQAGHASANSLYVPAAPLAMADTADLVIGNVDLGALAQPAIRMKVAATAHPLAGWCTLQLLFRDQCSSLFNGSIWQVRQLNELAADNGSGFVPDDDGQWTTVQAAFPEWAMASSAEFTVQLIRSANAGLVPEAFYLDDLFIGEAEAITGIASPPTAPTLVLWPNPAHERVQVRCARPMADARLSVSDATGRQVEQHLLTGDVLDLDVAHLAKGTYLITLADGGHRHHARLIVP